MTSGDSGSSWEVPQLGPSLGRLTEPPSKGRAGVLGVALDDIRLDLVTGVFDLAAVARSFIAAGDRDDAVASLNRVAWLGLWERALAAATARIAEAANVGFNDAAVESRFHPRRLQPLLLTTQDHRAIAARLGSGGATFVAALDVLEQSVHASSRGGARGRSAPSRLVQDQWRGAVTTAARRLESAWLALEDAALAEQRRWQVEIELVRAWRRPVWPLWTLTLLVLAAATYLGLVFGGIVPVPAPLRGVVLWWWSRL
jgi:hypothetical protein